MSDAAKLVSKAARAVVQDIDERYDEYHAHLVHRFVEALRIQHSEAGDKAQRRAIETLVKSFGREVSTRLEEVT